MTIARSLAEHLRAARLPEDLRGKRDERLFQIWLAGVIGAWAGAQSAPLIVKAEAQGGGVRPVEILGTGFWPDIAIGTSNQPTKLAVEVKCLTRRNRASHTSQPIGQALMYREMYEECVVVLVLVEDIGRPVALPEGLSNKLLSDRIELVWIDASGDTIGAADDR